MTVISIHDNSLKRVAYMDNDAPKSLHYYNDDWRRLLKEATSTFSFTVDKTGLESEQYLNEDNYVSFKHDGVQYLFSIMRTEETEQSINVYAENLNLELLNETKNQIDVTTDRSLIWYLNNDFLLVGAGLTLGVNEVSDQTRKIKIESEQTGLARLISIANNFGAEVEFKVDLNSDGTLNLMFVNFFKKYDGGNQGVGTNRQDVILYYGRNIEGITRTVDKTDVYNVITPTGKDGLNITSLVKKEYDENGVLEYYTDSGSPNIYAPQSKARYRAQLLNDADGWLRRYYSADGTSNVNTLYTLALNEIKKHAYPAVTYDVTGYFELNIGDTVRIQDSGFTPSLTLQARVAEQSICFSDPTKNKTTFGNVLALESRVSQDLTGRLKELVDEAAPYRFEIISSDGLTFKNSQGNTTLTARVYKGSAVVETVVDSFEWLIDGVSFGGTEKSQTVSASQVTGTAVVRYNAVVNEVVIGGVEVTLQDIVDGKPTGLTQSDVEPSDTYDGMLWQYTGEEDLPVSGLVATTGGTYRLNDIGWEVLKIDAESVEAKQLEDITDTIGVVKNSYTVDYGTGVHTGTVTIENGITIIDDVEAARTTIDFTSQSSGQGMFAQYLPNKNNALKYQQAWYTPFSLRFDDAVNDWHGQITAENVTPVPWTNLTYSAGYTTAENNPCQYRKIRNLDGSYKVEFRGQVRLVSGNFLASSGFYSIANLPVGVRPNTNKFANAVGDVTGAQTIRIGALTDGNIQIGVRGTATAYVAIDSLGYTI